MVKKVILPAAQEIRRRSRRRRREMPTSNNSQWATSQEDSTCAETVLFVKVTSDLNFPRSKLQFSSTLTLFNSPTCSFVHHPSSTSLSSRYSRQWGSGNVLEGLFRWLTCVQLFDKYLFRSSNVFLRVRWYMKDKTYNGFLWPCENGKPRICLMFFNSARKYSFVITSQFLLWYSVTYILRDKNFLE